MRITRVDTIPISLPLRTPVRMANKVIETSHNVLVRVSTDESIVGWGEAADAPLLTGHTQGAIVAGVEFLAPGLVGQDPTQRAALWLSMRRTIYGNSSSIAAIDLALHDLAGKAHSLPVCDLIGGRARCRVPAMALFGSGDPERDLAAVQHLHALGYRSFKMKLGLATPEVELQTLIAIRAALGNNIMLAGDANTAWTPPQAIRALRLLGQAGLAFVEQPVGADDIEGMARVAAAVEVPIAADEGIHGFSDVVRFAQAGIAGVSLKLIKMGGITGVVQGAVLAHHLGLEVSLGGKIAETSIASAGIAHAAAVIPSVAWGTSLTHGTTDHDVTVTPLPVLDGYVAPPAGPGLGVEVDEEAVAALRR